MVRSLHRRSVLISGLLVVPLLAAAPAAARAASSATVASPKCSPLVPFHAREFPRRPEIDNKWLPLVPGNNSVLSGTVRGDDGKLHPHTIASTVTDLTKVIDG